MNLQTLTKLTKVTTSKSFESIFSSVSDGVVVDVAATFSGRKLKKAL